MTERLFTESMMELSQLCLSKEQGEVNELLVK